MPRKKKGYLKKIKEQNKYLDTELASDGKKDFFFAIESPYCLFCKSIYCISDLRHCICEYNICEECAEDESLAIIMYGCFCQYCGKFKVGLM
jgi:hypothetical protein